MSAETQPEAGGGRSGTSAETLESLFLALEGALLRYALRLVRDLARAEDLVQEAFLRLQAQTSNVAEPRAWLYRTVHNLAISQRRVADREVAWPVERGEEAGSGSDMTDLGLLPDEHLARWEGIGLVRLGLEGLDERSRQVVHLKFDEGLSYREISERTGLGVGHVGYLLHHALKALTEELLRVGLLP